MTIACGDGHREAAIEAADRCVEALLSSPSLEQAGFPGGLREARLSGYDVDTFPDHTSVFYGVEGLSGSKGLYLYFDYEGTILPPTRASEFQVRRIQLMGRSTSLVDVEVEDCSLARFAPL